MESMGNENTRNERQPKGSFGIEDVTRHRAETKKRPIWELEIKLRELEQKRRKEQFEINEIRARLGLPVENKPSTKVEENTTIDYENHIRHTVKKVQDIYINATKKYLPEESILGKQIIKFYSDPERLFKELSNVFRGVKLEEIDQRVGRVEELFKNKKFFIKEVKSKNFSTSE